MVINEIIKLVKDIKADIDVLCSSFNIEQNQVDLFNIEKPSNSINTGKYVKTHAERQQPLFDNNLNKVVNILKDFNYSDEQNPNETKSLFGVVTVKEDQAALIRTINTKKKALSALYTRANFSKNKRSKNLIKEELGSRFCARQAYRTIPFTQDKPSTISFSVCNTRAVKTINKEEALKLVLKIKEGANVDKDTRYLSNSQEQVFAIVKKHTKHIRANIRIGQGSSAKQKQIKTALPLFVYSKNSDLPKINKPFLKATEKRKRKNEYLSEHPVLLSINAHNYIKEKSGKW